MKARDKEKRSRIKKEITRELASLSSENPAELLKKIGGAAAKGGDPQWVNQVNQDRAAARVAEGQQNWGVAAQDRVAAASLLEDHQYRSSYYVDPGEIATNLHDAAGDFANAGNHLDAARNYKAEAGFDEEAGWLGSSSTGMSEAYSNEASQYQDAGQNAKSAAAWVQLGQLEDSVAENYDDGDLHQQVEDYSNAAQAFMNAAQESTGNTAAGDYQSEASSLMKLGNVQNEIQGDHTNAQTIFTEAANASQQAAGIYASEGETANLAKAQFSEGEAYDAAGNYAAANSQYDFARQNFANANMEKNAGEASLKEAADDIELKYTWQEAVNFQQAGQEFDAAKDYSDAASAYQNSADWYAKGQNDNWQANEVSALEAAGADYNKLAGTASGSQQISDYQNAAAAYDKAGHLDPSQNQMSDFSNAATAYQNIAELQASAGHHENAGNAYNEEAAEWQQAVDSANNFDAYSGNYTQNENTASLNAAKELLKHDISTNDWQDAGKQENIIAESQGNEAKQASDYEQAASYFEQANDKTDAIAALQNAGSDYQDLGNSENGVNGQKATEYWQDAINDYQKEANLDEQLGSKAGYKAAGNVLMNEEAQVLETWDPNWNTANGNGNIDSQLRAALTEAINDYTEAGDKADAQTAEQDEKEIGGGN